MKKFLNGPFIPKKVAMAEVLKPREQWSDEDEVLQQHEYSR